MPICGVSVVHRCHRHIPALGHLADCSARRCDGYSSDGRTGDPLAARKVRLRVERGRHVSPRQCRRQVSRMESSDTCILMVDCPTVRKTPITSDRSLAGWDTRIRRLSRCRVLTTWVGSTTNQLIFLLTCRPMPCRSKRLRRVSRVTFHTLSPLTIQPVGRQPHPVLQPILQAALDPQVEGPRMGRTEAVRDDCRRHEAHDASDRCAWTSQTHHTLTHCRWR